MKAGMTLEENFVGNKPREQPPHNTYSYIFYLDMWLLSNQPPKDKHKQSK